MVCAKLCTKDRHGARGGVSHPVPPFAPCALFFSVALAGCPAHHRRHSLDGSPPPLDVPATMVFRVDGHDVRTLTREDLERAAPPETVTGFDPYYNRTKTFLALPLTAVLHAGLADAVDGPLALRHFVLEARDGYTVPIPGDVLLDGTAYLAVRDLDVPGWEPIGPQHANPAPFYLVWKGPGRALLDDHPRPWQLTAINAASFASVFPHTVPVGAPGDSAESRGFGIFARECIRCHAINREGGHVGPDLNVPQNITEYRP